MALRMSLGVLFLLLLTSGLVIVKANELDTILIIRPDIAPYVEVERGLFDELHEELKLETRFLSSSQSKEWADEQIADWINELKPKLVIIMGDDPARAYDAYQKRHDSAKATVILGTHLMPKLTDEIKNSSGIFHDAPLITALAELRDLLRNDISNVGVIYRSAMRKTIQKNAELVKRERFKLIAKEIDDETPMDESIKDHLKDLKKSGIDTLWILSDSALFNDKAVSSAWGPALEQLDIPVIVSVPSMVKSFADFGYVVDHYHLGVQAANLVFEAMDNEWRVVKKSHHPVSIKIHLNKALFEKKRLHYRSDRLSEIDTVYE